MNKCLWILALALALGGLVAACGGTSEAQVSEPASGYPGADEDDGDDAEEIEEAVPVEQVPAVALEAAIAAVPGFVPAEAEKETERGSVHYCIHGYVGDEFVEVEVSPKGEVLEIERGDEEDED